MKRLICLCFILYSFQLSAQNLTSEKLANLSRCSSVKILSKGVAKGSGFFISDDLIATCFHVVAWTQVGQNVVGYQFYEDLIAVDEHGNVATLECISVPSEKSLEPIINDFAVLRLKSKISGSKNLKLSQKQIEISDKIIFSGYPFGLPTLITHTGEVSGMVKDSLIYVQAPVNNGNSGSALLNKNGEVIGIVSFKQASIGQVLEKQLQNISYIQQTYGKRAMKVSAIQSEGNSAEFDPVDFAKETIVTLRQNMETGIGGAQHIRFLSEYLKKNNIITRYEVRGVRDE